MIKRLLLLGLLFVVLGFGFIYSGYYPMGADVPHNQATYWLLETMRERSIARAADEIQVPDLSSPAMLLAGGADYNDMCSACHLKPEVLQNDMSIGLYPAPPNLALSPNEPVDGVDPDQAARRNYWIIKHGIKASGMPAWGPTHDDDRIWAMVAFLQKLPELTPDQYQIITAR